MTGQKAQIQSLEFTEAEHGAHGSPLAARDMGLIKDVEVGVTAILGDARLTVKRLFSLRAGDVVELVQHVDEPVVFQIDGRSVARGRLVAVDDRLGVEITEVL